MIGSAPRFPAFEDWEKMTEQEQDALLGRMEAARRRKSWLSWTAIVAGLTIATYVMLSNSF
jgi:hypothetical protein